MNPVDHIQATFEIVVEVNRFFNVDLFQRGFYQLRSSLRLSPKVQAKVEVSLPRNSENNLVFPACVMNGAAVSKTFQILYRREDIPIDDVVLFKVNMLVDVMKIQESMSRADIQLVLELWFTDDDFTIEKQDKMQLLTTRALKLHLDLHRGLSQHLALLFDYFHLSAVTLTIHASLLNLLPPHSLSLNQRVVPLGRVLFGRELDSAMDASVQSLLDRAFDVHRRMIKALLSAYESLQSSYEKFVRKLPPEQRKEVQHVRCAGKFQKLCEILEELDDVQVVEDLSTNTVAQCCAENIMLWTLFVEQFVLSEPVHNSLAKQYHKQRVRRFAEAFFTHELPRVAIMEPFDPKQLELIEGVRSSPYFASIPPLATECAETDGEPGTLPIVVESIFASDVLPRAVVSPPTTPQSSRKEWSSAALHVSGADAPSLSSRPRSSLLSKRTSRFKTVLPNDADPRAVLVGFRKFGEESPPGVSEPRPLLEVSPSGMAATPPLQLGTFTPTLPKRDSLREQSFPSLVSPRLMRAGRKRESSSSLPELGRRDDGSASPVSSALSGSDSELFRMCSFKSKELWKTRRSSGVEASLPARDGLEPASRKLSSTSKEGLNLEVEHTGVQLLRECEETLLCGKLKSDQAEAASLDPLEQEQRRMRRLLSDKCTIYDMFREDAHDEHRHDDDDDAVAEYGEEKLVAPVDEDTLKFLQLKESLRREGLAKFGASIYSEFGQLPSSTPYFCEHLDDTHAQEGLHLVICVHGLDGNSADLRLVRTYLELSLPGARIDFLMSERNQRDTFADFESMTSNLLDEIEHYVDVFGIMPDRISFVGHSLGNLIIRAVVARTEFEKYRAKLYTYLSLSGPHLGTLYNPNGLVNMGMWLMQKWKKSGSLLQLAFKDHPDPRKTFMYQLSKKPCFELFKHVLLVGSAQDRYVPFHSTRVEMCTAAQQDSSPLGSVYTEMVMNLLRPAFTQSSLTFVRYNVFHALPAGTNSLIGRAAHIAVLDSEIFLEKFITVSVCKYFR